MQNHREARKKNLFILDQKVKETIQSEEKDRTCNFYNTFVTTAVNAVEN